MRIFLTGSSGFVGRNLVKAFSKDDIVYKYKRGEDVSVISEFKPDVIYHLAAELHDDLEMFRSNAKLTGDLLSAASGYKAFIYIGTSSEYGMTDKPMQEDSECYPTTVYACTKIIGTLIAQLCANSTGRNIIILRPFSLYGTDEPRDRFFPTAIRCTLKNKNFHVWEGHHDWTHIDDFVKALLHFSKLELPGQIINIGTGIQASNKQVVDFIAKKCKKDMKIIEHKGHKRAGDSPMWVADVTKAIDLGWSPTITLEEGLKRQIKEIKKGVN